MQHVMSHEKATAFEFALALRKGSSSPWHALWRAWDARPRGNKASISPEDNGKQSSCSLSDAKQPFANPLTEDSHIVDQR